MADAANLSIRVDSSGARRASRDLNRLESQGRLTERSTTKLTSSLKMAGVAAGIAAVAFAGFVTAKAVRDISNFTQAIADLSAITGATGENLAFYADSAKEIGRTTSLSASQAVEAFKLIGSAKPDLLANAEALESVTKSAVTLAEASGVLLPEAARALGSALNQFGLDAAQADNVINILAASAKFGAAEIPAVTEALRNVGSAANALDVDLAETVAGIQALAIAGKQGSDAGTSLRQVLLKLEKTADKNLQPSIVGLSGALNNLKALNLSNAELMTFFGEEAFAAATALLEQSDNVAQLNKNLRGTNTAVEQAGTRMNTLEGDAKELDSAIEGLSIEIGESLLPALRHGTQGLTGFINEINRMIFGKSSVKTLEDELTSLENKLENSDFFGRSGKSAKSFLTQEIEELKIQILLAKAASGELPTARSRLPKSLTSPQSTNEAPTSQAKVVKELTEAQKRYQELIPLSSRYNKSLRTPIQIYNDEIMLLNELRDTRVEGTEEALLSSEKYARGVTDAQERLDRSLEKTVEEFKELNIEIVKGESLFGDLQTASEGWAATFADSLVEGGLNFENFANGILKQLQKIALEKAFAPVFGEFASGLTKLFQPSTIEGSTASLFGGAPSANGGGFTGSGPRSGGVDGIGGFPAILHPNETVIDHTKGQKSGNSMNIVVNVDASGSSSTGDEDGKNIGNLIGIAVRSVLIEESRPGGMLA